MSKQEEIIDVCGKKVVVRYAKGDECPCQLCDLIPPSDEWCCLASECEKYCKNGKEAYFKEVPKPLSEEYHSLRGWAQILATNPALRAEFDKMCPPQPIQGSIAPEVASPLRDETGRLYEHIDTPITRYSEEHFDYDSFWDALTPKGGRPFGPADLEAAILFGYNLNPKHK